MREGERKREKATERRSRRITEAQLQDAVLPARNFHVHLSVSSSTSQLTHEQIRNESQYVRHSVISEMKTYRMVDAPRAYKLT